MRKSILLTASLIFLSATPFFAEPISNKIFIFTAAGDYAKSEDTNLSLKLLAETKPDFHLALGDFSYNKKPEKEWTDYVRSYIGDMPFELVSGNHESRGRHGYIDNFMMGLRDKLGAVGDYGREYYFDYPAARPLARFILISPGLIYKDQGKYSYSKDSPHYQWLSSTIDSARIAKIPWVIVGMHKNCLSAGSKNCEIGEDVFNLLIAKKVDLILQGHDHTYQRSKQIALNDGCPSIYSGEYNEKCVAHPSESSDYPKGDGTIVVIDGTFGAELTLIAKAGGETDYFLKKMGRNRTPTKGFMKFTVSEKALSGQFMRSSGEAFEDHFEINDRVAS